MARYPEYEWDQAAGQYRNLRTGRLVSRAHVTAALERAIAAEQQAARRISEQLRDGLVTVRQWETGMREVVKNTQLFSAAAARGGWAQMDARTYGQVGAQVRTQYGYLDQFRNELRAGLGRDAIASRAAQYADAARTTRHLVETDTQREAGKGEERSVLSIAEHCLGCVVEAQRLWQPLGSITPVGQRECKTGCKCQMEYR